MELTEQTAAVQRMQDYIRRWAGSDEFSLEGMYAAAGYSRRHADRLFKELLGQTPREYLQAVLLTQGAARLRDTRDPVLDIALDSRFASHEGFTRAFESRFSVAPSRYRRSPSPIPLFVQYPIRDYQALIRRKEECQMSEEIKMCTVTVQERPRRKLLYLCSKKGKDYLSFCEEMGCEWEGLLNSIPQKMDTAALLELPPQLVKEGSSNIAAGVELPLDYCGEVPEGYALAQLPAGALFYFQSEPYDREEDFCLAIESVQRAVERYRPEPFGYRFAPESGPSFNFGAEQETGARLAVPAVKL